jgi:hypothetical protein
MASPPPNTIEELAELLFGALLALQDLGDDAPRVLQARCPTLLALLRRLYPICGQLAQLFPRPEHPPPLRVEDGDIVCGLLGQLLQLDALAGLDPASIRALAAPHIQHPSRIPSPN